VDRPPAPVGVLGDSGSDRPGRFQRRKVAAARRPKARGRG
jgi:hypothetical protein